MKVNTIFGSFDEEQLSKLKDYINETVRVLQSMDTKKVELRDVINAAHEDMKIPKKIIRRMAKVQMNQSFQEEVAEYKEFEALFEGMNEAK
jgi:ribosomal protein L13E